MFAILAVLIFMIAALVVDLGQGRAEKRASQGAADASALAAGNVLFPANSTPRLRRRRRRRQGVRSQELWRLGRRLGLLP